MPVSGAGMQGPAGVRTDIAPVETANQTGMGDLEPGVVERPEGIVSPSGVVVTASAGV